MADFKSASQLAQYRQFGDTLGVQPLQTHQLSPNAHQQLSVATHHQILPAHHQQRLSPIAHHQILAAQQQQQLSLVTHQNYGGTGTSMRPSSLSLPLSGDQSSCLQVGAGQFGEEINISYRAVACSCLVRLFSSVVVAFLVIIIAHSDYKRSVPRVCFCRTLHFYYSTINVLVVCDSG